ncbi:MAG: hypothetical protein MUE60_13730 [Candidatus Eisenbacteria bacterium]|jgi:hypothetical protein|nr:hypothetical protein [Candidatus Eisenbacteria bacterium]
MRGRSDFSREHCSPGAVCRALNRTFVEYVYVYVYVYDSPPTAHFLTSPLLSPVGAASAAML